MGNESLIPADLAKAAGDLEAQFESSKIPIYRCPQKDWDALPKDIKDMVPAWIAELLSRFGLASGWLEFPDAEETNRVGLIGFLVPGALEDFLQPGSKYRDLIKFGFFPFIYEEGCGSVWVVEIRDGPEGKVFMLNHSGWDGTEPTRKNGLDYPHKNLASLLAVLKVSDLN